MKIDINVSSDVTRVASLVEDAVASGYDGAWLSETRWDPFAGLAVAANGRPDIDIGTATIIAFARTPMTVAVAARDIQALAHGRFMLGISSQIRPHITRRFSMPWSSPAPRMKEFISAVRAIWHTFETGEQLAFEGDFYTHNLLPPEFNAGPSGFAPPPILLGAVGVHMTRVAAQVADGLLLHPMASEHYIRTVALPAVAEAREKAGLSMDGFITRGMPYVATGLDEDDLADNIRAVRKQIAFHGSTPAYSHILEAHGWGDLHTELHTMSKNGQWDEMGHLIDDTVLHTFAVVGERATVAAELDRRYGDLLTRLSIYVPYTPPEGLWEPIVSDLKSLRSSRDGGPGAVASQPADNEKRNHDA